MTNLGNVVALLRRDTAPDKKYIIWARPIVAPDAEAVELLKWSYISSAWVPWSVGDGYILPAVTVAPSNTPPVSPTGGTFWLIADTPTGVWDGHARDLAEWTGSSWVYHSVFVGAVANHKTDTSLAYQMTSSGWQTKSVIVDLSGYYTKLEVQGLVNNGLSWNSTDSKIQLGGDLTKNTNIYTADKQLQYWLNSGSFSYVFSIGSTGVIVHTSSGAPSANFETKSLYDDFNNLVFSWSGIGGVNVQNSSLHNYISQLKVDTLTSNRSVTMPDDTGVMALLDDTLTTSLTQTWSIDKIKDYTDVSVSGAVMLTGNQSISGIKSFVNDTEFSRIILTNPDLPTTSRLEYELSDAQFELGASDIYGGPTDGGYQNGFTSSPYGSNIVYYSGYTTAGSVVFKITNDGGATWDPLPSPDVALVYASPVSFKGNPNDLYTVGFANSNNQDYYHSPDAGVNWSKVTIAAAPDPDILYYPKKIKFKPSDATKGFIVGYYTYSTDPFTLYPYVLKTTNGGSSWTDISGLFGANDSFEDIEWCGPTNNTVIFCGSASGPDGAYYSTNDATTVTLCTLSSYSNDITQIVPVLSTSIVYMINNYGVLFKSTDSGVSFVQAFLVPDVITYDNYRVSAVVGDIVYIGGSSGRLFKSKDSAATFNQVTGTPWNNTDFSQVATFKGNGGYLLVTASGVGGEIYRLDDATEDVAAYTTLRDSSTNYTQLRIGIPIMSDDAVNLGYMSDYVDARISASDAIVFKGVINASSNPNYPAASVGHLYRASVAGKIGGASGVNVEVGDSFYCIVDTAAGNQATVGVNWQIVQANLDGAVIGAASSTNNNITTWNGTTGKLIKDSGISISLLTSFNTANLLVQLNGAGELPALSGVNLTALNATQLTSGTVPVARLSLFTTAVAGIVNASTAATGKYLKDDNTWFLLLDDAATTASTTKTWSANKISTYISGSVPTNGLQAISAQIGLGGTLVQNTNINGASFNFTLQTAGVLSVDVKNRTLNNSGGVGVVDYENLFLGDGSSATLSFGLSIMYDNFSITSHNWKLRRFYDNTGALMVDYQARTLNNGSIVRLDWENGQIKDAAGVALMYFNNGLLLKSTTNVYRADIDNAWLQIGSVVKLDWMAGLLHNAAGELTFSWDHTNYVTIHNALGWEFNINATNLTANRTVYLPNKNGTFAVIEDLDITRASVAFSSGALTWGTFDIGDWVLSADTTWSSITSPVKGAKRYVITGNYKLTITVTGMTVVGMYVPGATNYLRVECLSETTPEYIATWMTVVSSGTGVIASSAIDWNAYNYQSIALGADTTLTTLTNLAVGERFFEITGDYEFTLNSSLVDPKKIGGRYVRGMTNYLMMRCINVGTPKIQAEWKTPAPTYSRRIEFDTRSALPIEYASSNTGTGANSFVDTSDSNSGFGAWFMTTGTTTTGRSAITTLDNMFLLGGTGIFVYETSLKLSNALSDGTDTYRIANGLLDTVTTTDVVDGVFFLYDTAGVTAGSAASVNWQLVASNNSSRTFVTTSVAVVTGSYIKLRIEVSSAAAAIRYYINDVLVGTITTSGSIPKTTGRETGEGLILFKSAGTNSRGLKRDYAQFQFYAQ